MRYQVHFNCVTNITIEVEADSPEEAEEKAYESDKYELAGRKYEVVELAEIEEMRNDILKG